MHLKFKGVAIGVMAFLLGAAVVYAMPNSIALSATKATPHHGSGTVGASAGDETSETEAADTEANGSPVREAASSTRGPAGAQGTHGAAVSALAHCAIKGSEHGALVSSVAVKPDATVAGSIRACTKAGGRIKQQSRIVQGHDELHGQSGTSHGNSAAAHRDQVHPSRS